MSTSPKSSHRLAIALLLICLVTGCSKTPSWFKGRFQIDLEATTREIERAKEGAKTGEGLSGAAKGLAMVFAPFALAKAFGGSTVTISSNEIITIKDGNGTVVKFEVHETPTKDSVSIKTSDGKIETWMRTETGISKIAEGDVPIRVHFKRQP